MKNVSVILAFAVALTVALPSFASDLTRGMRMEVYISERQAMAPTRRPLSVMIDPDAGPEFRYEAPFIVDEELNEYRQHDWGIEWSGFIKIAEPGTHTFNLKEIGEAYRCGFAMRINSEPIFRSERMKLDGENFFSEDLQYAEGWYPFNLWMSCANYNLSGPSVLLRIQGPNDPKPRTMFPGEFGYRAE